MTPTQQDEIRDKHFKKMLIMDTEYTNRKIRGRQEWRKHQKAMMFRLKGIFILFVVAMAMMFSLTTP